ncbi:MAG: response regulator [Nitrospirota bacterium]
MSDDRPDQSMDFLLGGGEMGRLIRSMDWSQTPLGRIQSWPQSLRTAISICLASDLPICIIWGPDLVQLYNDGYRVICGDKHPSSMGQNFKECWREAWPVIGEAHDSALAGETAFLENQHIFLDRHGYTEECFFTFSFSPIRDEAARLAGLFHPVIEMTPKLLGERRTRTLRDLVSRTSNAKSIEEAFVLTTDALHAFSLDLPFLLVYRLDDSENNARLVAATGLTAGTRAAPERVELNTSGNASWPFTNVIGATAAVSVDDVRQRFGDILAGPFHEPIESAVLLPIMPPGAGRPLALVVAGVSARLKSNEMYRGFYDLLGGAITTAVANARAYEEERRRAEALAELDRAKTAFFSNVSHEFRTPLTLMLGPVEELLSRSRTELAPSAKGQLEVVHRNGLRLLRLVNTLLDFSRIEAGRVQASYVATDLAAFTAELASCFRSATERAGLTLVVDCPLLSEPVYVDRDMWEKIVLNLLSNAFKFTFVGEIEISLKESGEWRVPSGEESGLSRPSRDQTDRTDQTDSLTTTRNVTLSVRDTGTGIPAEEMPRLFERFYRVPHMRSRTHEGSGIGLALVQELAKLHGGSVYAESDFGKGSTFAVTIPLGTVHLQADKIAAGPSGASGAMGAGPFVEEAIRWLPEVDEFDGMDELPIRDESLPVLCPSSSDEWRSDRPRIIIADDNVDMRQYIARLLSERYAVETASDGEAALASAKAQQPDLILSDVMMPRLDGFGLLRELRADPQTKTIPVILLSARAGEESRIEDLEQGADDYLIKPFTARELLARVAAHLDMARVRREAQAEIARSKLFLERIATSSPDLLFVYDIAEGRNLYINRRVESMLGYTAEQFQAFPGDLTATVVHPDDLAGLKTWFSRFDGAADDEVLEHEHRLRRADGSFRWLCVRATLFERTAGGGARQIIGVASDITERKQAEGALRESEERYRTTFANAAVGIAHVALDGRWLGVNDAVCRITGYEREELLGKFFADVTHPDDLESEWANARRLLAGETATYSMEKRYLRKDGGLTWIHLTVSLQRDESGSPNNFICIIEDITERKRAEQALRESEEQLRTFSGQLEQLVQERTEELVKTQGRLRALATELILAEQRERKRLAGELHDYLAQLLVLCRLNLGQVRRGGLPTKGEEIVKETEEVLNQALNYSRTLMAELSPPVLQEHGLPTGLKWLAEQMQRRGLAVTVDIKDAADLALSEDCTVLLFQSVRELLINALKHAGSNEVAVRLDQGDGKLRIEVRDDGVGFDLAAAAFNGTTAMSSKFGLFSIRERMKALGGWFHIESEPGQGTTATLALPLAAHGEGHVVNGERPASNKQKSKTPPHSEHVNHQLSAPPLATHHSSCIRVLLVDDHAMVRQGLRSVLESYSDVSVVGEATNGKEAVVVAAALRPSIVLMDINMPNMNGIDATAEIKQKWPDIPVIGLSVNADVDNQAAMISAGAAFLLTKEAAVDELYQAIQDVLRVK